MTDALHIYALDHPQLARTLKAKLIRRRIDLGDQLVEGYASEWADYRERVGVIKGLAEAIAICDQVEKEERE